MAEVLTEWPTIVRTRTSKFPWAEWTDGQIRQATKGTDFDSEPKTFVQGLYAHAKRHGKKVKVGTVGEDSVVFSFYDAPPADASTANGNGHSAEAEGIADGGISN